MYCICTVLYENPYRMEAELNGHSRQNRLELAEPLQNRFDHWKGCCLSLQNCLPLESRSRVSPGQNALRLSTIVSWPHGPRDTVNVYCHGDHLTTVMISLWPPVDPVRIPVAAVAAQFFFSSVPATARMRDHRSIARSDCREQSVCQQPESLGLYMRRAKR